MLLSWFFFSCLFVFKFNYRLPNSKWPKRKWHNKSRSNCFQFRRNHRISHSCHAELRRTKRINGPFLRRRWLICVKFQMNFFWIHVCWCEAVISFPVVSQAPTIKWQSICDESVANEIKWNERDHKRNVSWNWMKINLDHFYCY